MVRDNVTGLIWEIKDDADGTADFTNPHDPDNTYYWCDKNPATNGGDQGNCSPTINTEDFIKVLNSAKFGGSSKWRLPTIREMYSLYDYGQDPPLESLFRNWKDDGYWTATTESGSYSGGSAWYMRFVFSYRPALSNTKNNRKYAVAVRGSQTELRYRFVDNFNGTVTDAVTGLVWQKETADPTGDGWADAMNWQEALSYCKYSTLGGYTDWRLPDNHELASTVDFDRYYPATRIPDTKIQTGSYVSSTSGPSIDSARRVNFYQGEIGDFHKSYGGYVRCVRGKQLKRFSIVASAGKGGKIKPSGDVRVLQEEDKTFKISPNCGYRIDEVEVDGILQGAVSTYTFYSVSENHTITASFAEDSKNECGDALLDFYLPAILSGIRKR